MTEDKPMTQMAQSIINKTISKNAIYPDGVARRFGYIESVIDWGFSEEIPAEKVIEEIYEQLSQIKKIMEEQADDR